MSQVLIIPIHETIINFEPWHMLLPSMIISNRCAGFAHVAVTSADIPSSFCPPRQLLQKAGRAHSRPDAESSLRPSFCTCPVRF